MKPYFDFKTNRMIGITFFPTISLGGVVFPPELRFSFWFFCFGVEFGKKKGLE